MPSAELVGLSPLPMVISKELKRKPNDEFSFGYHLYFLALEFTHHVEVGNFVRPQSLYLVVGLVQLHSLLPGTLTT